MKTEVMLCHELPAGQLAQLAGRFGVKISEVSPHDDITGSYWGDSEAGLKNQSLFVRGDTPVHSALHELCHFVCMAPSRRTQLHTNAGGDYDEENGVCYLQILLSDFLSGMQRERMMADMDRWGYSFRLGSARRWFAEDAEDACEWLRGYHLVTVDHEPTFQVRTRE